MGLFWIMVTGTGSFHRQESYILIVRSLYKFCDNIGESVPL